MPKTSKIAHLPRAIRDELNSRLDDGESGETLLPWLNSLPEAQTLLAKEFNSRPISKQNLALWKKHGFHHWLLRRNALEFAAADSEDSPADRALAESISRKLNHWVALRYAALAHSLGPSDLDPQAELAQLATLCEAAVSLRRGDLSAERLQLEQKRLELLKSHTEAELEKLFWDWTKRPDIEARLHPRKSREELRREAENILNYKLLGIPYPTELSNPHDPDQPHEPEQTSDPNALADPALLI